MRLDVWIGLVTFAMAALGGIVSAHAPQKAWQKWAYGLAFVVLGGFAVIWVVKQSNESAQANGQLATSLHDLGIASTKIEESTKEAARLQDLNTKLQNRLLDASKRIITLSKENINQVIGGDSFAYVSSSLDAGFPKGDLLTFFLFNDGKYQVYDIYVLIDDVDASERFFDNLKKHPGPLYREEYERATMFAALGPFTLLPHTAMELRQLRADITGLERRTFQLHITTRNGLFEELIAWRRIKNSWTVSEVISRRDAKKGFVKLWENTNSNFPKDQ